jgi:AcrR family transcriptional regulator
MPRSYRLGERAVGMDATRSRIIEAAIELYAEQGISATTIRQIGHRADVAPGTFPSRDLLDAAMVERLKAEVPLPELSLFDGAPSIEERLARLIRVTGTFLDQAARLYRMWLREPMLTSVWTEAGAAYGARWDQLMRAALGPVADDDDAMAVLRAVLEMSFFENVRAGTRTTQQVSALVTAAIVPWFAARASQRLRERRRVDSA